MALIKCKDCQKEFSTDAKRCPHCGANKSGGGGIAWLILILVVLMFLFILVAGDKNGNNEQKNPEDYALSACRGFIEKNAHDSSSVEFDRAYPRPVKLPDGNYSITIPFRAKNGFGALRHGEAECIMRYDGSSWWLEKLNQ